MESYTASKALYEDRVKYSCYIFSHKKISTSALHFLGFRKIDNETYELSNPVSLYIAVRNNVFLRVSQLYKHPFPFLVPI